LFDKCEFKNAVAKFREKPKVFYLALIGVEILFVPGFGTKRLERKAGIWLEQLPKRFAPKIPLCIR